MDELMEILRRPKEGEEEKETNRQFYGDNIFVYGPLLIRARSIYEKVLVAIFS